MPSQLPSAAIDYAWSEYTTPGLAVVNMTWDPPQWSEFITSYNITMFSQSDECGGHQRMVDFFNISRVSPMLLYYLTKIAIFVGNFRIQNFLFGNR